MPLPQDAASRKYYRVARQRLEDAELILSKINRPAAAVYLAGYAIECILKALLLAMTPIGQRPAMLKSLKQDLGHDLGRLREALIRRGLVLHRDVSRELLYASSWSPELRYEPGPGNRAAAERFLASAQAVVVWAENRM